MRPNVTDRLREARGGLLVAAGALLWGTVGIASKAAFELEAVSTISVAFYRLLFCLPLLLLYAWTRLGRQLFVVSRSDRLILLALALCQAVYQAFYFAAVREAGVTLATLVALGGAPFLVALLAALLLGERPGRPLQLALLLAVPGAILLIGLPGESADIGSTLLGSLLAGVAAFGYAGFALASRRLAGRYSPVQLVVLAFGGAALTLAPIALSSGLSVPSRWEVWGLLIYAGLVPTALAYLLFFMGMRTASATLAGLLTVLEPLTAALLAWSIFGERLGPLGGTGAALILASLVMLAVARRRATPA